MWSHPMILIGGDGHEARFREGKRAEVPVRVQVTVRRRLRVHHVEAWLVSMHGVQDHLEMRGEGRTPAVTRCRLSTGASASKRLTNMPVVIQQVVGELEAVERYRLLHPLGSAGRRVGVKVHPAGRHNVRPPCHQPGGAVERVPDTDSSLVTLKGRARMCRVHLDPFQDKT